MNRKIVGGLTLKMVRWPSRLFVGPHKKKKNNLNILRLIIVPVATYIGLTSLAERRRLIGLKFLAGLLLNNNIDSSILISPIYFIVTPRSFRSTAPFYVPHATTNYYMANEPLKRLMLIANADLKPLTIC